MIQARMIMGVGGAYTCVTEKGELVTCSARKKLKKTEGRLTVGDFLEISPVGDEYVIERILPRKNILMRPPVSNIDQLLLLLTELPKPDYLLVDKLLVLANRENIPVIIGVSKSDAFKQSFLQEVLAEYGATHTVIAFSAHSGEGMDALQNVLQGKCTALAGQSAVGKSSLLNALTGQNALVGELSRIDRGRQTTRHTELYPVNGDTLLADTPGFSNLQLDFLNLTEENVCDAYPEYLPYSMECRFLGCAHLGEPDCAVKQAVEEGLLSKGRYQRYVTLRSEARERDKKKYD